MDMMTMSFWGAGIVLGALSLKKNKVGTMAAIKKTRKMMGNMLGEIVGIIFLIGLVLAIIPQEKIEMVLGGDQTFLATLGAALVGSVTLIPAFVAFPLVGSIVDAGASLMPAVAFLTTLTMVGMVTFPLEQREFGLKFALLRNGMSFVAAIVIALVMGLGYSLIQGGF